jgi:hypothetical protein
MTTTKDTPAPDPTVEPDTPEADVLMALGEVGGRGTPEAVGNKLQAMERDPAEKARKRSPASVGKALKGLETKGLVWPQGDEWLLSSAFLKEGAA